MNPWHLLLYQVNLQKLDRQQNRLGFRYPAHEAQPSETILASFEALFNQIILYRRGDLAHLCEQLLPILEAFNVTLCLAIHILLCSQLVCNKRTILQSQGGLVVPAEHCIWWICNHSAATGWAAEIELAMTATVSLLCLKTAMSNTRCMALKHSARS